MQNSVLAYIAYGQTSKKAARRVDTHEKPGSAIRAKSGALVAGKHAHTTGKRESPIRVFEVETMNFKAVEIALIVATLSALANAAMIAFWTGW